MWKGFDIGSLLAGIAIFLLGVRFLEEALQQLSGRGFKLFLKKQTRQTWKAIGGGALVTALLQSSSVVSLMVLAFCGTGILTLTNALALILGANLGTTTTGWMLALAGFNMNIEAFALPVAGVAGIGYALLPAGNRFRNWSRFFLGLSFLFVGLDFIRTGMESGVLQSGLARLEKASLLWFLLAGFLICSLIQSSSATLAIALSALHSGALELPGAVAVMLGAEVGTTVKLFLASADGQAVKRQVALGNFLFNLVTTLLVLLFLQPALRGVTEGLGIHDPLIALVFFQTGVNIAGILLFFPLLKPLSGFLKRRYPADEVPTVYLQKSMLANPPMALAALEKEGGLFLQAVLVYFRHVFGDSIHPSGPLPHRAFSDRDPEAQYNWMKHLHGEIHSYYLDLQQGLQDKAQVRRLDRLFSAVRNAMYAAKSIKDALPDARQLRNSSNDHKYAFYVQTRGAVLDFCQTLTRMLDSPQPVPADRLLQLYESVMLRYRESLPSLYEPSRSGLVNESELTTLLNFNREVVTAFKSLVFSVRDFLFTPEQGEALDDLPGFIH